MLDFKPLYSEQDASVNFVAPADDGGFFEARFVQREPRYFICYLSSQSGCDQACRFCHLTQTKQTTMQHARLGDYSSQAVQVFQHYDNAIAEPAEFVNFNFMARGEPMLNPSVFHNWSMLHDDLSAMAKSRALRPQFNISTIMPKGFCEFTPLSEFFRDRQEGVSVYYSLYSMKKEFRKRWLPKAMDPRNALDRLTRWQQDTGGNVVLHWSFIEGENDDLETLDEIIQAVKERGLQTRFNLVRYNPYSPAQGKEPSDTVLAECFNHLAFHLDFGKTEPIPRIAMSRVVPRVGFDVKASCGMFVSAADAV